MLFALHGFAYATWAGRVPAIQARYGLSDASVGLVLLTASLGAFAAMPFAGAVNARLGLARVAALTIVAYAAILALIPFGVAPWHLFVMYAALGVSFGLLDVAHNAQAVEVEQTYGRPLMSSFHAGFSGAMIAGALGGSLAVALTPALGPHLLAAGGILVAGLAWVWPRMPPEPAPAAVLTAGGDLGPNEASPVFRLPVRATWLLGLLGFCSMMSEASISDWTSKFMLDVAGSPRVMATWSLAGFSGAMTLGRVFGDRARTRLGDRTILQVGPLLALLGLGLSVAFPTPWTTVLGATLVGVGLSVAVPIMFSLAGRVPGLAPSVSLAMVTSVAYLGLFLGPAVIGFLTEAYGLRAGYGFILGALAVMASLAGRVR